jgi:transcriptional regulator with XRE-family HTH domain
MSKLFGDLLRDYRVDAGVSLITVARHLGLSVPYVSDIERNKRAPLTRERILKVAELLNVRPETLLTAAAEQAGIIERKPDQAEVPQHTMGRLLLTYHRISDRTWQKIATVLNKAPDTMGEMGGVVVSINSKSVRDNNSLARAMTKRRRSEVTNDPGPPARYEAFGSDD